MKITRDNYNTIVTPRECYILTNGETFSEMVFAPLTMTDEEINEQWKETEKIELEEQLL